MSRIGKKAVAIPSGVKVSIEGALVTVEGKTKLAITLPDLVKVEIVDNQLHVVRDDETRQSSAMQGLVRSLINNMVIGVTQGFKKDLSIIGVGYKAQLSGQKLVLNLGYSHPVEFQVPAGIKITVTDGTALSIEGADKQVVGQVAATIRRIRPPEPYKGKGVRYVGENITLKEGKTVG